MPGGLGKFLRWQIDSNTPAPEPFILEHWSAGLPVVATNDDHTGRRLLDP